MAVSMSDDRSIRASWRAIRDTHNSTVSSCSVEPRQVNPPTVAGLKRTRRRGCPVSDAEPDGIRIAPGRLSKGGSVEEETMKRACLQLNIRQTLKLLALWQPSRPKTAIGRI